jgi:hypothetical protein
MNLSPRPLFMLGDKYDLHLGFLALLVKDQSETDDG